MIGNSFSISLGACLPEIVRSCGHSIKLASAYIGGCSLEHHVKCLERSDSDPSRKPYGYTVWFIADGRVVRHEVPSGSVNAMLKDDSWDVVTVQQASHFSWDYSTYRPYADILVNRVRADQPSAEIMIQQTWSYRAQDARFNAEWAFDQTGMYERLDSAYRSFASDFGLRRIPTGLAVQFSRERTERKFKVLPATAFAECRWPDLPSQAGDVVGNMAWRRAADGELEICRDDIHLNARGEYLQACVWYGAIYGEDPRAVRWTRDEISISDGAFLRECAYDALVMEDPSFMNCNE